MSHQPKDLLVDLIHAASSYWIDLIKHDSERLKPLSQWALKAAARHRIIAPTAANKFLNHKNNYGKQALLAFSIFHTFNDLFSV